MRQVINRDLKVFSVIVTSNKGVFNQEIAEQSIIIISNSSTTGLQQGTIELDILKAVCNVNDGIAYGFSFIQFVGKVKNSLNIRGHWEIEIKVGGAWIFETKRRHTEMTIFHKDR